MSNFWNKKFEKEEYLYGKAPNRFLEEILPQFSPGKILFPAEGEGRNAVYAAMLGWKVFAFDQSEVGKEKAEKLAAQKKVEVNYRLATLEEVDYPKSSFDAIALFYAHFEGDKRQKYHRKLIQYLKKGGHLLLLGFSKKHMAYQKVNYKVGGPQNEDLLFDQEELKKDFESFDFLILKEKEVQLSEGYGHIGKGSVVEALAVKK